MSVSNRNLRRRVEALEDAFAQLASGADNFGLTDEFEGHINANGGVDLLASTLSTPPSDRKVRWLRESTGDEVGYIAVFDNQLGGTAVIESVANQDGERVEGINQLRAYNEDGEYVTLRTLMGNGIWEQTVVDPENHSVAILGSTNGDNYYSQFVQNSTGADRRIMNSGTGTVTFSATNAANSGNIAHGLGVEPTVILITVRTLVFTFLTGQVNSRNSTHFTVNIFNRDASNFSGTITFDWLAIAHS